MKEAKDVKEALDCCMDLVVAGRWASGCISCPYGKEKNCRLKMLQDASKIAEREIPLEAELRGTQYYCPKCKNHIEMFHAGEQNSFCAFCGQAIQF